jgi:hypothetical protein
MITLSTESLKQFISGNHVERVDGNILFDAEVKFWSGNSLHTIISQVQIIVLPNEIALYIFEFLKEVYNITEMYRTGHYYFTCPDSKVLEIRNNSADPAFLISIKPV